MNTNLRLRLAGVSLAAFLAATAAHATLPGLSVDPMGSGWNREDANSAYSIWDTFPFTGMGGAGPMGTFSNHAPGATFGFGTPLLSQPVLGPIRAGSGDRIYSFGSSPVYSIDTSTSFVVKGFVLQMKQFRTEGALLSEFFAPTLNGIAADYVMSTAFVENVAGINEPQTVTTWFWGASLASQNFTDLDLQIADQGAGHYSVDAITIDAGTVSVIPEPTAVSLLGGAGLLFLMRRRRGPVALAS